MNCIRPLSHNVQSDIDTDTAKLCVSNHHLLDSMNHGLRRTDMPLSNDCCVVMFSEPDNGDGFSSIQGHTARCELAH